MSAEIQRARRIHAILERSRRLDERRERQQLGWDDGLPMLSASDNLRTKALEAALHGQYRAGRSAAWNELVGSADCGRAPRLAVPRGSSELFAAGWSDVMESHAHAYT